MLSISIRLARKSIWRAHVENSWPAAACCCSGCGSGLLCYLTHITGNAFSMLLSRPLRTAKPPTTSHECEANQFFFHFFRMIWWFEACLLPAAVRAPPRSGVIALFALSAILIRHCYIVASGQRWMRTPCGCVRNDLQMFLFGETLPSVPWPSEIDSNRDRIASLRCAVPQLQWQPRHAAPCM